MLRVDPILLGQNIRLNEVIFRRLLTGRAKNNEALKTVCKEGSGLLSILCYTGVTSSCPSHQIFHRLSLSLMNSKGRFMIMLIGGWAALHQVE